MPPWTRSRTGRTSRRAVVPPSAPYDASTTPRGTNSTPLAPRAASTAATVASRLTTGCDPDRKHHRWGRREVFQGSVTTSVGAIWAVAGSLQLILGNRCVASDSFPGFAGRCHSSIPLAERAARVQACSSAMGRQGSADTLVARRLHWSCTVVARCRGTLSECKKATFCTEESALRRPYGQGCFSVTVAVSRPTNLGSTDVRWSAVQRVLMRADACRWLPVAETPASWV